jgi:hypothetical protein
MRKKEKDVLSLIGADIFFLLLAVERDDPKDQVLLRIKDMKKRLDTLMPNK